MSESAPLLSLIRALLARGPRAPAGDIQQGLELLAALGPDGHVDTEAYYADPRHWLARRFYPDRPDWHGVLVREEEAWALRGQAGEDGPLWFLHARGLRPGEYVTLCPPSGEEISFRVVGVTLLKRPEAADPSAPSAFPGPC